MENEVHDMPARFATALSNHSSALINFSSLSIGEKNQIIDYLHSIPSGINSKQNIAKAIVSLEENRTDFI